jgi:hypothetical protein
MERSTTNKARLAAPSNRTLRAKRAFTAYAPGRTRSPLDRIFTPTILRARVVAGDGDSSGGEGVADAFVARAAAEIALHPFAIDGVVGLGWASTRAAALRIMPGVQKPHWKPFSSAKARWTGWSRRPSMVVMAASSHSTARIMQDFTGLPSSRTVQAPQSPFSQPHLAPVSPSFSRSTRKRVSPGRTAARRSSPLTCRISSTVPEISFMPVPPARRGAGAAAG